MFFRWRMWGRFDPKEVYKAVKTLFLPGSFSHEGCSERDSNPHVCRQREVYADGTEKGILIIPVEEMRLQGADVIVLNVAGEEMAELKSFDDLRRLRTQRGDSIFTIAPHPFYRLGGSIGSRLFREIDCFDAIEFCHFHVGLFNPNRRAKRVASRFGKPLIATSDAHRLHAFGRHYTSIPKPSALTAENVFAALRSGPLRLTSPACSLTDLMSAIYFVFLAHPFRVRRKLAASRGQSTGS